MERARLVRRFTVATLDARDWTHEARLVVGLHTLLSERALRAPGADAVAGALASLRPGIDALDRRSGRPDGYHETITTYYLRAIDRFLDERSTSGRPLTRAAIDALTDELLAHPEVDRDAPRRWWDEATLASDEARRSWVAPTLDPSAPLALVA